MISASVHKEYPLCPDGKKYYHLKYHKENTVKEAYTEDPVILFRNRQKVGHKGISPAYKKHEIHEIRNDQ
jgi:hypothetical protein